MKRGLFSFITILFAILCPAQMANIHKMSPLVRQALAFHELPQKSSTLKSARQKNMVSSESPRFLTAFVKFSDHAEEDVAVKGHGSVLSYRISSCFPTISYCTRCPEEG